MPSRTPSTRELKVTKGLMVGPTLEAKWWLGNKEIVLQSSKWELSTQNEWKHPGRVDPGRMDPNGVDPARVDPGRVKLLLKTTLKNVDSLGSYTLQF